MDDECAVVLGTGVDEGKGIMNLKSFLQTLSKEELISLIFELADKQEKVKDLLNEKFSEFRKANVKEKDEVSAEQKFPIMNNALHSVTRLSSPQEKIDLFKAVFRGRQDVFALRWYNAKSQKSGYSPVCGNKWASGKCDLKKFSCATCLYKLPVALDDKYIFNHLAGRDEFCRDVIGLYPLMEGNICCFLAMDFDSHTPKNQTSKVSSHANYAIAAYNYSNESKAWQTDILTVHKTFADFGIPSYIEVSRSGNGGHLWIFFENAISARLARNLGTAMLKASMQNRHSIPFESFFQIKMKFQAVAMVT